MVHRQLPRPVTIATCLAVLFLGCRDGTKSTCPVAMTNGFADAYLGQVMDRYHKVFWVYSEADAPGNHFVAKGRISSAGDEDAMPAMNEACLIRPHSGHTCIEASFLPRGSNWGGWYFLNGILEGEETTPRENWGDHPNAGVDLRAARHIVFWVRGATGNESIEFFTFGVGWNLETGVPILPYAESSRRVRLWSGRLTQDWQEITVDISRLDRAYVLGGFGWVATGGDNADSPTVFYLDDIYYDWGRTNEPRFLASYETRPSSFGFDIVMRNVAFSYDNAVTVPSFLAASDRIRAGLLCDAFVYAQNHDRFFDDGRVRNAYQAGDLILPAGWRPHGRDSTVRMPGWYDPAVFEWYEDRFQASTHTGNVAWAMLALISGFEELHATEYLNAAVRAGDWVETHCRDSRGAGGYTGGFDGWEPNQSKLLYKSTEHNLDLYVAFRRLYDLTGEEVWREQSDFAKAFVDSMWDDVEGKFWTGTLEDGVTINQSVIPVDVQAWAVLAFGSDDPRSQRCLEYAESHHLVGNGFDFNEDRDGVWYEGTAHMALAYLALGGIAKWRQYVSVLQHAQPCCGVVPAADREGLTTGFDLPDGSPWLYFNRPHVGATAWLSLAERGMNPFWMQRLGGLCDP